MYQNRLSPGYAEGAYSAPPDPLAAFDGPTSKRGEGRGREGRGWEMLRKIMKNCYATAWGFEIP